MTDRIKLDDKYEVVLDSNTDHFEFKALRYGNEWRDLTGDNLILAMFFKIKTLEETKYDLLDAINQLKTPEREYDEDEMIYVNRLKEHESTKTEIEKLINQIYDDN